MKTMMQNRNGLKQAIADDSNPARIKRHADTEGAVMAGLIMHRLRMSSRIKTLLSQQQQRLIKQTLKEVKR